MKINNIKKIINLIALILSLNSNSCDRLNSKFRSQNTLNNAGNNYGNTPLHESAK